MYFTVSAKAFGARGRLAEGASMVSPWTNSAGGGWEGRAEEGENEYQRPHAGPETGQK